MTTTLFHRLILPVDANHHGTLYAGSLLGLALEAGYATAWRHVGHQANLVLPHVNRYRRRILCHQWIVIHPGTEP